MLPPELVDWPTSELKKLLEHLEYFECSEEPLDRDRILTMINVLLPVSEQLARTYDGLEHYTAPPLGKTIVYNGNDGVLTNQQVYLNQLNSNLGQGFDQLRAHLMEEIFGIRNTLGLIASAYRDHNIPRLNKLMIMFSSKIHSLESHIRTKIDTVTGISSKLGPATRNAICDMVKFTCVYAEDAYKMLSNIEDWNDCLLRDYGIMEPALMIRQSLEPSKEHDDCRECIRTDQISNENRYEAIMSEVKVIEDNIALIAGEIAGLKEGENSGIPYTVENLNENIDNLHNCINVIRNIDIQADIDNISCTHQHISKQFTLLLEYARTFLVESSIGKEEISEQIQSSSDRLKNIEERYKDDIPNLF